MNQSFNCNQYDGQFNHNKQQLTKVIITLNMDVIGHLIVIKTISIQSSKKELMIKK